MALDCMKVLLMVALLSSLALAGCTGGDSHAAAAPVTCPDGTVLTGEQVEAADGHHDDGFDAASLCPVAPSVRLNGLPTSLQAFLTAPFTWTLDNGTVAKAHSMLTSIRYSTSSVEDRDLTNVNKYPTELLKREHQDLPVTYQGNLSFAKAGTVYLRAYMEVAGKDYWSPEVVLNITPVPATGVVVDVTHAPGDFLGGLDVEEVTLDLGDALRLVNEDLTTRTLKFASGPAAVPTISAGAQGASDPVVFAVPGLYEFTTNDLQAQTLRVLVTLPA
jgi:hypothetical protein